MRLAWRLGLRSWSCWSACVCICICVIITLHIVLCVRPRSAFDRRHTIGEGRSGWKTTTSFSFRVNLRQIPTAPTLLFALFQAARARSPGQEHDVTPPQSRDYLTDKANVYRIHSMQLPPPTYDTDTRSCRAATTARRSATAAPRSSSQRNAAACRSSTT